MDNGKKGVTIIALGIVLIVMGLLVGLGGIGISDLVEETQVKEFASELQQLEYLSENYLIRNNGRADFEVYELSTAYLSDEFIEQLSEERIVENKIMLHTLELDKIDAMDTNYGQQKEGADDIYLLSEETGNVYYKLGIKYKDVTYYTLTDELKDILEN